MKKWNSEEEGYLLESYERKPAKEVARVLGRTVVAVYIKARKMGLRRFKPDLELSPTLSYLLGALLGDGCAYVQGQKDKRSYIIQLATTEKKFAECVSEAFKRINICSILDYVRKKGQWRVRACNKYFFDYLKGLTLDQLKQLTERKKNCIAFLKGFYEAEGYFHKNHQPNNPDITISNTNAELLNFVKKSLERLGFHPCFYKVCKGTEKRKPLYRVDLCRTPEVKRFIRIIQPVIKGDQK